MISFITDFSLFVFSIVIWIFARFCPQVRGRWIFGAIRGQKYIDNTRHLFEFASHKSYGECIWISRKKSVVREIRSLGYKAYGFYSFIGIWKMMTAEVAFYTHQGNLRNGDLPFYALNRKVLRVQTWHGIPLKKIVYDDKINSHTPEEGYITSKIRSFLEKIIPFLSYVKKPHLVLALSEETQAIFSKCFRVPKEKVVITGYPRNDLLLSRDTSNVSYRKILYMPTFRGKEGDDFDPLAQYGFNLSRFEDCLRRNNCKFYVKMHPLNLPHEEMIKLIKKSKDICLLDDIDIYYTLATFDILVTDFSSVFFDFLLLDKPMIFTPFDFNKYVRNERELYYDYDDVTPGPKAHNWDEFLEILDEIDHLYAKYVKKAQALKRRFHQYVDAESSERVINTVLLRLERGEK